MSKGNPIQSLNDIRKNLDYLEKFRVDPSHPKFGEYSEYIRGGSNYVAYSTPYGPAFAPSRFIGYKENNFSKHKKNSSKSGGVTDYYISKLFNDPVKSKFLELAFIEFCRSLDTSPHAKKRKYWDIDGMEQLDIEDRKVLYDRHIKTTEKLSQILSRRGQGVFRNDLLTYWKGCCITGIKCEYVLRASHIKPWKISSAQERTDVYNGLLLTANLDAIFDKGLISFRTDGSILRSKKISKGELIKLGCDLSKKVVFDSQHQKYLDFHRKNIFMKN